MNVLLIGAGGREHALAWLLNLSASLTKLWIAPGNPGTSQLGSSVDLKIPDLKANPDEIDRYLREVIKTAIGLSIDLVVVGPELPLSWGLADQLRQVGIDVFGPSKDASQIESSKVYMKQVAEAAGVPTAPYKVFRDSQVAIDWLRSDTWGFPIVVKEDGLASGKGVTVAETLEEALEAVKLHMSPLFPNMPEKPILIEKFLKGREVSAFLVSDVFGHSLRAGLAQDTKQAWAGGPMTGGMGAFSPVSWVTSEVEEQIWQIGEKMLRHMAFTGCFYLAIMVTDEGPYLLEVNCRFGDPEMQALVLRWQGDALAVFKAAASGVGLETVDFSLSPDFAVCVVMCSAGYPDKYEIGFPISGLTKVPEGVLVFHAGTIDTGRVGERIVTAGGRVVGVTARGKTLLETHERVYKALQGISFKDCFYREDIGLLT